MLVARGGATPVSVTSLPPPLLSPWRRIGSFSGTGGRQGTAAAGRLSLLSDWMMSDQNSGSKVASIMTCFSSKCHSVVGEKS